MAAAMKGRAPRSDEQALWRAATRDVARRAAPRETAAPEPVIPDPPATPRARKASPTRPAVPHLAELLPGVTPGVDRRSADRLRRGELTIDGRLDLHGMTQAEAHRALDDFLARAETLGWRCLLVITGKGGRAGAAGVLRAAVPRWLNEAPNRARLLAFTPAQPRDGGAGALYVLLRRKR